VISPTEQRLELTPMFLQDCHCDVDVLHRRWTRVNRFVLLLSSGISLNSAHPTWLYYFMWIFRNRKQEHRIWSS
jgi:hypothetical protein